MQQKMMKYMMIFFGLMFYKVAAGLCIYFIASSVWGFTERKLLPKLQHNKVTTADDMLKDMMDRPATPAGASASKTTAVTADDQARRGKQGRIKKKDKAGASNKDGVETKSALGRLRRRLSNWWTEMLKQAEVRRQAERKK
jgi:YidC/Oxa1 family membrane protein insertase